MEHGTDTVGSLPIWQGLLERASYQIVPSPHPPSEQGRDGLGVRDRLMDPLLYERQLQTPHHQDHDSVGE
jgi:hypothetical protein